MASYKALSVAVIALIMIHQSLAQYYEKEEYAHPKYSFEYEVKDEHTKDIKSQQETRDGDYVKGYYSLYQPDGKTRTVQYSADDKSGFNAIVNYGGYGYQAPKYEAPKYYAPAPAPYKYEAPKYYAPAPAAYKYEAPAPKYQSQSYSAYAKASVSTPHFSYSY